MTIPAFAIRIVHSGPATHIHPAGELDIATTPALEQAIVAATTERGAALVLDLRELTFMDSTGLRALAQANARAGDSGIALSIIRGPRQIERVLEISGLGAMLPLVDAPPESDAPAA